MALKNRIIPCLWFDTLAEEAAQYYTSIFKDSKINKVSRYTEAGREIHGKRQVVPKALPELLANPDPEKAKRAMNAMLKMKKFDIAEMTRAADG